MPATDQGLDPSFQQKIDAMIAASHGRLYINSGYRDNALQAKLYAAAVQKYGAAGASKWVAPPGHSNHNKGLAVDLGGDIGLAHQLAAQFGLTFPMSWEPWHIEPVGIRDHPATSSQAYTDGPPGTINPKQDPSLNSQPQNLLAMLSSALSGASTVQAAGAGSAASTDALVSGSTQAAAMSAGTSSTGGVTSTGGGGTSDGSGAPGAPLAPSATRDAFIAQVTPFAEAESKRTGIPAEVFIVQSGLETGWGTSGWWIHNKNPAGIGVTGAPGAGESYPDLATAFRSYADHLMGHGEAGQDQFVAHVKAGAGAAQLLADLEQSPWAAGRYGGNGLSSTYQQLFANKPPLAAPTPAPAAVVPDQVPAQRGGMRQS